MRRPWPGIFLIIFVASVGTLLLTPSSEEIEQREQERANDPTSGAAYACREFITANLVAPSTAEFGAWSRWPARQLEGGAIEVLATFDAQNSFGAMLRQRIICEVSKSDGQWFLENLEEM